MLPSEDFYNMTTPFPCYRAFFLYFGYEPIPQIKTPKVIFFDVETTGLDVRKDRIIDLALCVRDAQTGREEWKDRLIHPEGPIDQGSIAIHGITDEMVAGALPFRAVAKSLAALLSDATLIAHNGDEYDVPILQNEMRRAGIEWEPTATIDTLRLARRIIPGLGRNQYRLQALAERFGFPKRAAHRAKPDVETLIDLWNTLLNRDAQRQREAA
jgi:DNA polymerase-3 subunit epsilon